MPQRVAVFSTKRYDRQFLDAANADGRLQFHYLEPRLTLETSPLAADFPSLCVFVNDQLDSETLAQLAAGGTRNIALRCAGFNNVDLPFAAEHGIRVARVPAYSPYSVAEHTVGLILTLDRKLHRAYSRVRDGNFALDGLLGFDLHGRTIGVVGTGAIGALVLKIMHGFGCRLLGFDVKENPDCQALGVEYVPIEQLFEQSDVISLHCPLTPQTRHLIDDQAIAAMKQGVMIINTSRGAVIDTRAAVAGLKTGKIGYLGLDVYEEEADLFFEDLSNEVLADDVLARLLTFPNVIVTGHQAFFTTNALQAIAQTTVDNLTKLTAGEPCENEVKP